jgi:hypothetical protein
MCAVLCAAPFCFDKVDNTTCGSVAGRQCKGNVCVGESVCFTVNTWSSLPSLHAHGKISGSGLLACLCRTARVGEATMPCDRSHAPVHTAQRASLTVCCVCAPCNPFFFFDSVADSAASHTPHTLPHAPWCQLSQTLSLFVVCWHCRPTLRLCLPHCSFVIPGPARRQKLGNADHHQ